jgi:hypothetical protein
MATLSHETFPRPHRPVRRRTTPRMRAKCRSVTIATVPQTGARRSPFSTRPAPLRQCLRNSCQQKSAIDRFFLTAIVGFREPLARANPQLAPGASSLYAIQIRGLRRAADEHLIRQTATGCHAPRAAIGVTRTAQSYRRASRPDGNRRNSYRTEFAGGHAADGGRPNSYRTELQVGKPPVRQAAQLVPHRVRGWARRPRGRPPNSYRTELQVGKPPRTATGATRTALSPRVGTPPGRRAA